MAENIIFHYMELPFIYELWDHKHLDGEKFNWSCQIEDDRR